MAVISQATRKTIREFSSNMNTEDYFKIVEKLAANEARIEATDKRFDLWFNAYKEDIKELKSEIKSEFDDIRILKSYADKWKSGLTIIFTLGSIAGWAISQADKIKHFLLGS